MGARGKCLKTYGVEPSRIQCNQTFFSLTHDEDLWPRRDRPETDPDDRVALGGLWRVRENVSKRWRGAAILSLLQGCESCLLHEDVQGYQEVLGGAEGAVDVQVSFQLFCGLPQRAEGVLQPEGDGGGHGGLHSGNLSLTLFCVKLFL